MTQTHIRTFLAATALAAAAPGFALAQDAPDIAVLTPYLSSVTTNEMVETFSSDAEGRGWSVNVVDTRGDVGQLASRIEDVTTAGVDAIVLASVDPAQVADQVKAAADAGIAVIAIDGALADGVSLNVTSDNFQLGTALSDYLFEAMGGEGDIVKFYHSAHPGVRQRELALDKALEENEGINVIAEHYVQVPGPIDDARVAMEAIVAQHGDEIDGVWAAWDEPAIGAYLALDAMAPDAKVVIAGIDGNPQAVELIGQCSTIAASVKQDFPAMAASAAEGLAAILDNGAGEPENRTVAPTMVTRETIGANCTAE